MLERRPLVPSIKSSVCKLSGVPRSENYLSCLSHFDRRLKTTPSLPIRGFLPAFGHTGIRALASRGD